jgi:hypothetical protein
MKNNERKSDKFKSGLDQKTMGLLQNQSGLKALQ